MGKRCKIVGIEKLTGKLKENASLDQVKRTVRYHGSKMNDKIVRNADFKGHYEWEKGKGMVFEEASGTTKRSVHLELKDGGLTAESGATTEYAEYLEYGTRHMDEQPFIKPAFDEQKEKFKKDMKRLVE